ncbi:MAG TPA: hypothetical protein VMV86_01950 [Methanosarcinales archaeon]|nr:hypothetical protein [Methanosarcinales archaeon]
MRIIRFTILKVIELAGLFFVWWGLSWYGYWLDSVLRSDLNDGNIVEKWFMAPFIGFLGIYIPVMICIGIYFWIKWNWKIAGK